MSDRLLDPDRRPSLRLRLAAVLLERGRDPEEIARTCQVPLALLELMREQGVFTRSSTSRGTLPRPRHRPRPDEKGS